MSGVEARLAEVLAEHRLEISFTCSCGEWRFDLRRAVDELGGGVAGFNAVIESRKPAHEAHVAAALAVLVAEEVTAARTEAWDEGWDNFSRCAGAVQWFDADGDRLRPNPYRAAAPPSSIGSGVGGQGGVGL